MTTVDVNATLLADDGSGGTRSLSVDDFKTPATGASTEATLAAVLAKLSADPASQTTLAAALVEVTSIAGSVDGVEGKLDTLHADLGTVAGKDFATQTSLAAFLEANHADLEAVLAKNEAIRALLAGTLLVESGLLSDDTDGRTVVTTAGARVALASSTPCKWVQITAESDNTGKIVVGGASTVVAALATRRGTPLDPGETIAFGVADLADVGLDSEVDGDGVTYIYGA